MCGRRVEAGGRSKELQEFRKSVSGVDKARRGKRLDKTESEPRAEWLEMFKFSESIVFKQFHCMSNF
jgi:hypothetical protein